jgi:uncharacterized DUF497 family protein
MEFDWDEHNLLHIALHGLSREDVEAALVNNPVFVRDEVRSREERRSRLGRDESGRILLVVTTQRMRLVRVVTSFPAGKALRQYYLSRKGEQEP